MHIRHLGGLTSALLVSGVSLLGFALPALANTTILSSSPTYAAQPFASYCQPYVSSFESGKHYVPQNGVPCTFSVPATLGGSQHEIAIYRGIPGASVFTGGDQYVGSPTLIQEDSVSFGTPLQDQDFFSVIYGANTVGELNQFNAAFTTGSSTNTLLPSDNYRLIRWKWGGVPTSEYTPVVIIPDFLNSWQKDTGLVIDPIFKTYQNLLDTFVTNGYIAEQNLFVLPYNWEESLVTTAQTLAAKIAAIKATCGCSKVDVVAHGSGGYVALQYMESAGYQNDINQVVLLGTGLYGVPSAYKALEGGQISFGNPLSDGLAQVFLTQEAKDSGAANVFSYIQNKTNTGFKEIIPALTDYLYDQSFNPLTYPTGYPQNTFLENILSHLNTALQKTRVQTVLADDSLSQTPAAFMIANSTQAPLWPHGQPTQTFPDAGDGLVTRSSIENYVGSANYEVASSHRALPTNAESVVFKALNNKNPTSVVNNNYPVSCVLFLTTSTGTDIQITDPNGKRLGKDFTNNTVLNEIPNSLYSGFTAPTEYGAVVNPISGTYQVRTQGVTGGLFTLSSSEVCGQGTVTATSSSSVGSGQLVGFNLDLSTSTQALTISPLDINAPTVVINTPINGHTYFNSATTSISVSITDPENSPIASTTYKLNGAFINPLQLINFASTTLGTSTLAVSAKDVFGNTGYATSTFVVVTAPVSNPPPAANLSASADTYLRGIASDTNEGSSTLLRIQGAGDNRVVVKFNQAAIAAAVGSRTLASAKLEFNIQGQRPNWGNDGREVVVNRLLMNWAEGNGKNAEFNIQNSVRGTGAGATWHCATDSDIHNTVANCAAADDWEMRLLQKVQNLSLPWAATTTDGLFVQNNQQGMIDFDVTADIQAFLHGTTNYGWIVRKSTQNRPGYITFDSREVGSTGPKLILTFSN